MKVSISTRAERYERGPSREVRYGRAVGLAGLVSYRSPSVRHQGVRPRQLLACGSCTFRTLARILVAIFILSLGTGGDAQRTGLLVEISPDARWGPGAHSLAIGGPLQMAGAALLLSGRKTPWALGILVCYVALGSVFGNLPQVFKSPCWRQCDCRPAQQSGRDRRTPVLATR